MVPKQIIPTKLRYPGFRAVLFRMVPKPDQKALERLASFRAVLFRMVPKQLLLKIL